METTTRMSEVLFKDNTESYLRNGVVKTHSIVFTKYNDVFEINVRTSKGLLASGHINVPLDSIDDVIAALSALKSNDNTNIK